MQDLLERKGGEPPTNLVEYTVSELAFAIKRTVEDGYGLVRLRGEVSGFRGPHGSGHCYFTLKDEKASIDAIVWKSTYQRLKFKPEEGLEMIVTGRVTTYPDRSKYQIVIDKIEPAGVGALMALLEERRKKLAAEGLFDEARKKPLPFLPRRIGVVTSPTGAVIRDILHRLEDRFPSHVLVWPVRVQGETCAAEVSAAIVGFNAFLRGDAFPSPDLLIVARGGGSIEDLWPFNEEIVVRAVAASVIPLISAVGHETDWTLIDHVADWRAPTPTAAAERAVPVRAELVVTVGGLGVRKIGSLQRLVQAQAQRLRSLIRALPRLPDILALPRQRFDHAAGRLGRGLRLNARLHHNAYDRCAGRLRPHLLSRLSVQGQERLIALDRRRTRALRQDLVRAREALEARSKLLGSLGYQSVLARGFALVRDGEGRMVRRAAQVKEGAALDIQFADGHVQAQADSDKERAKANPPKRPGKEKQGTLL
jgi:exodeoxyribonuclease VII large subunit